ncbi:MAG: hypothetical protein R3E66_11100 [bacterium]
MTRLTEALLLFASVAWLSGCNVFAVVGEGCSADIECDAGQICDSAINSCRVADSLRSCEIQTCGVAEVCENRVCVARALRVAVINDAISGPLAAAANVQNAAIEMAWSNYADRYTRGTGRSIEFKHLLASESANSQTAAFERAAAMDADVVVTLDATTTLGAQRYFYPIGVFVLGLFTDELTFEALEPAELRTSFALIPPPDADFAMWATFLSQHTDCTRVSAVYVSNDDLTYVRFASSFIEAAGLTFSGALKLSGNTSDLAAFEQLGSDCAFALPLTGDPAATFDGFLAKSPEQKWLFTNINRYDQLALNLSPSAAAKLLNAVAVSYEVGGDLGNDVAQDLRGFYQLTEPTCYDDTCAPRLSSPELVQNELYAAFAYDQSVLTMLASYYALKRATPTRADIRTGFRSINGGAASSQDCSAANVIACFDAIDQGASPNYQGASGDLVFGRRATPETIEERMIFLTPSTGAVLLTATHSEMSAALRALTP